MFTVCSKCDLRLVVTAADLRAAQGYVRCGRCHNIFNALAALSDDVPDQAASPQAAALAPPDTPGASDAPDAAAALADNPVNPFEFNPARTDLDDVFVAAQPDIDSTGTFESIILVSDELRPQPPSQLPPEPPSQAAHDSHDVVPVPEESLVATGNSEALSALDMPEALDATAQAMTAEFAAALPDTGPEGLNTRAPPAADAPRDETAAAGSQEGAVSEAPPWAAALEAMRALETVPGTEAAAAAPDPLTVSVAAPRPRSRLMYAAAALLILGLLGQIAHHYRGSLAAIAALQHPLTALYAGLGVPLYPSWDISHYEVHQLGAVAGAQNPGDLIVRASITNTAPRVQPLPLLRVVVQDRFGNPVAARDVRPAEYLPPAQAAATMMQPGQQVHAQADFVDPGPTVVGFEIDACLLQRSARVVCANDPGGR